MKRVTLAVIVFAVKVCHLIIEISSKKMLEVLSISYKLLLSTYLLFYIMKILVVLGIFAIPLLLSINTISAAFAQSSSTGPNPIDNGKVLVQAYLQKSHRIPGVNYMYDVTRLVLSFSKKNATYELVKSDTFASIHETSISLNGKLKISTDDNSFLVRPLFVSITVTKITKDPSTGRISYFGNPDTVDIAGYQWLGEEAVTQLLENENAIIQVST